MLNVLMTNFPGDAVKLETEILLNRFRCAAEIARLSNVAEHEEAGADDRSRRADNRERVEQQKLEEIERRVAEAIARHRALIAENR